MTQIGEATGPRAWPVPGTHPYGLPTPLRPGQIRAVDRLLREVRRQISGPTARRDVIARVQYHAATGSGKTLVSRAVAEDLDAQLMAFGAPRIDLLGQAFEDYRRVTRRPLDPVIVCSAPEIREARGFPSGTLVTTSTSELRERLRVPAQPGALRVIFFTYQSSRKMTRAISADAPLDLLVLDEAHRVARPESAFGLVWDNTALPARVRLALTATPLPEMEMEGHYGVVADRYRVGDGIADGVLCDYRVHVLGVTDEATASLLRAEPDRRAVAVADALLTAISEHRMRRVLTFHRRRIDAHRFIRVARQVAAVRGIRVPMLLAQSGVDSPAARVQALHRLETEGGLIASPRIYLEGTDVRAIDTVVFVDPKSSTIDISQGVGRALRVNPADPAKVAQIVVSVAVAPDEGAEATLDTSEFRRVWEVLRVLAAQDARLAAAIEAVRPRGIRSRLALLDRLQSRHGSDVRVEGEWTVKPGVNAQSTVGTLASPTGSGTDAPVVGHIGSGEGRESAPSDDPLLFDSRMLLSGAVASLAEQVTLRAIEEVGDQRARDVALLAALANRLGTTLVGADMVLADGTPIGARIQRLRTAYRTGRLPTDLVAALEAIPQWRAETGSRSAVAEVWPHLLWFESRYRDATVPADAMSERDGPEAPYPLGAQVEALRASFRAGALPPAEVAQCETLAGWTWDPSQPTLYQRAVPLLREFVRELGHARVPSPADWPAAGAGRDLVETVAAIRKAYAAGTLPTGDARAIEREFALPWSAPGVTPGLKRRIRKAYQAQAPTSQRMSDAWAMPTAAVPHRGRRRDDEPRPAAPLRLHPPQK